MQSSRILRFDRCVRHFDGLALSRAVLVLALFQLSCSSTRDPRSPEQPAVVERQTEVLHEECDIEASSAERLDANGDGRADVTIVRDGNREICRAIDLNFDGVADSWLYFEPDGKLRRRERDYDRDGRIDEIALFRGGVLVEKQLSTLLTNKLDTWEYYEGGRLARAERDSDGDRLVDQWWEYEKPGCPLIHADANRDGRPDPQVTVDYCKETGYVPPERQDPGRGGPSFEQSAPLATQTEGTESPAPDAGGAPGAGTSGAPGSGGGVGGAPSTAPGAGGKAP